MKTSTRAAPRASWGLLWTLILIGLFALPTGCKDPVGPPPALDELHSGEELKKSGKKLIHIPLGTHRLTPTTRTSSTAILAVHGHASRGYEWVTSLHQFAESRAHIYWLRWNWNQCPNDGLQDLKGAIDHIHKAHPNLKEIQVFAHSYGGVISAMLAQEAPSPINLKVHVIASPLAGMGKLNTLCEAMGIHGKATQSNITLTQWRTQHKLDGAFKDEKTDPQVVTLPQATIIQLPETFNGRRLGHNWSVSYVATQWLSDQAKAPTAPKPPEAKPQE